MDNYSNAEKAFGSNSVEDVAESACCYSAAIVSFSKVVNDDYFPEAFELAAAKRADAGEKFFACCERLLEEAEAASASDPAQMTALRHSVALILKQHADQGDSVSFTRQASSKYEKLKVESCKAKKCWQPHVESCKWCIYHKCGVDKCKNKTLEEGSYCKKHTCKVSGCLKKARTGYKYCSSHKCAAKGCSKKSLSKYNYCENHKCKKKHCKNEVKKGYSFCKSHKCRRSGCNGLGKQDDGRCTAHSYSWTVAYSRIGAYTTIEGPIADCQERNGNLYIHIGTSYPQKGCIEVVVWGWKQDHRSFSDKQLIDDLKRVLHGEDTSLVAVRVTGYLASYNGIATFYSHNGIELEGIYMPPIQFELSWPEFDPVVPNMESVQRHRGGGRR